METVTLDLQLDMDHVAHLRKITDQLMYNQLCAPQYPAEDQTTVDQEETRINAWLVEAIDHSAKREDIGDWLRLGAVSIAVAFAKFRQGDDRNGRRAIEEAVSI